MDVSHLVEGTASLFMSSEFPMEVLLNLASVPKFQISTGENHFCYLQTIFEWGLSILCIAHIYIRNKMICDAK